jgi:hypothetical protein
MLLVPGAILVLMFTAFAGAACGSNGPATTTTGSGGAGSLSHPTAGNEVVLRVNTGGGFVAVTYNLTQEPEFTLYGDGTVIVTGPTIEIYPQPTLPNLEATKISEDAVQAILSAGREAGLFEANVDYGRPGITDMPTTNITINAGGLTYESGIYALGVDAGAPGLTLEQQQARAAVSAFVGKVQTLTDFVGQSTPEWKPFQFSAVALFSVAVNPASTGSTDVRPNKLEWPLGDLSTQGEPTQPDGFRKIVVSGQDFTKLQPLLGQATQITIWTSGGHEYNLYFRPLLRDETT